MELTGASSPHIISLSGACLASYLAFFVLCLCTVQDLSAYINEVKRDNETLHLINEIENR